MTARTMIEAPLLERIENIVPLPFRSQQVSRPRWCQVTHHGPGASCRACPAHLAIEGTTFPALLRWARPARHGAKHVSNSDWNALVGALQPRSRRGLDRRENRIKLGRGATVATQKAEHTRPLYACPDLGIVE